MRYIYAFSILLMSMFFAGCLNQQDIDVAVARANHEEIIIAKSRVYPALVFVKPIQETFDRGERRRSEIFGSGVIIDPDGYVVTNNHVAEKAVEINCVLGDRQQVPAIVVGLDPETDLALLKLQLPDDFSGSKLPFAKFADSDKVEAGQVVLALGAPFGFTRSISRGIISNTRRYLGFSSQHQYNLWFQTDAAINPGNSGGPLVDTSGRIVAINTLGIGSGGIGFSIPSNVVKDIASRLKLAAQATSPDNWPVKITRTYTGLQLQALRDFNTNTFSDAQCGVLIKGVDSDSPASDAGLRGGDILLKVGQSEIDGAFVEDLPCLEMMLSSLPSGKPVEIIVARSNCCDKPSWRDAGEYAGKIGKQGARKIKTLILKPIVRGKYEGEDFYCKKWNMTVREITKYSTPQLHFYNGNGVFISGVRDDGNASDAGMYDGQVILKIGDKPVKTLADVKKIYRQLTKDETIVEKKILFTIKSGRSMGWKMLDWTTDYLDED